MDLRISEAFHYYDRHINRQERFDLLRDRNFSIPGSVPSIDWELFGAILTDQKKKTGYGSDLGQIEIKSAAGTGSFEYQYHRNAGIAKLDEDMKVDHIFISYSPDYQNVTVRLVSAGTFAAKFESWRPGLIQNYQIPGSEKQRYRKSISFGDVETSGQIVMSMRDGQLVTANP